MEQKKKSNQKGLTIVVAAATWVLCLISAVGLFTVRDSQIGLWRDLSAMMGGFAPIAAVVILVLDVGLSIYFLVRGLHGKKAIGGLLLCLAASAVLVILPHLVSCGSLS